jgi:hypothetical protein
LGPSRCAIYLLKPFSSIEFRSGSTSSLTAAATAGLIYSKERTNQLAARTGEFVPLPEIGRLALDEGEAVG